MIYTWRSDERDPFRRGSDFGSAWRLQIAAALDDYARLFTARGVADATVREVADRTGDLVADHSPHLLTEMEGIAAGVGVEPWQVVLLNARTEVLAHAPPQAQECSISVLVPENGAPMTIQTWDWYASLAADAVVFSVPAPGGDRLAVFAEFGQLGKIGVNSRGLGVHLAILDHESDASQVGMPVHLASRLILENAATLDEACAVLDGVPFGASTVLTVVTPEPLAASLELSPAGWAAVRAEPGQVLAHTNHFLDPKLAAGDSTVPVEETKHGTRKRREFLLRNGDALRDPNVVSRARLLAADEVGSICVDPDPEQAVDERVQTKATLAIDVRNAELGYHESHPRDVAAASWMTFRP